MSQLSLQQYLVPLPQLTELSQQSLQFPLVHFAPGRVHGGEGAGGVGCKERRYNEKDMLEQAKAERETDENMIPS